MRETRPVRDGEELPLDALNVWLAAELPQLGRVNEVSQFPGGFSNLTYLLGCTHGEAVLRRPPRGYHYVRDDRGDYLLVGIATGVILGVILANNGY